MSKKVARFSFDQDATPVPTSVPTTIAEPTAPKLRPPSRRGKRNVNFVLSEHAWEQLSILSIRNRTPIQSLMQEAVDLLFQANGLSRIARD